MLFIQFFDQFEGYLFTTNEIDAVFDAIVWPQVTKPSLFTNCFRINVLKNLSDQYL